jgi:hypothetical protein
MFDVPLSQQSKRKLAEYRASYVAPMFTGLQKARRWFASSQAALILAGIGTVLLLTALCFIVFVGIPRQTPETASIKTDLLTSTDRSFAVAKGSPGITRQLSSSEQTEVRIKQSESQQNLQIAEKQDIQGTREVAKLSALENWIEVTSSSEFQTYFFKEVSGKGSSDARVSMLTNFASAQSLPDGSASFTSVMYVISIDCRTSTGGPVNVVWNTGRFLSDEYLSSPMPPLKRKQFNGSDAMFLFACS